MPHVSWPSPREAPSTSWPSSNGPTGRGPRRPRQSQDQINTGIQTHTGADGSSLEQRLDRAGYTNRASDGENAYAFSNSVDNAMEAFLIDWGVSSHGHRNNILQPSTSGDDAYREVGIGIVDSKRANFGPEVITQDFGSQSGAKAASLPCDLADRGALRSCVARAADPFGSPDILVCAAGVNLRAPLLEVTEAAWDATMYSSSASWRRLSNGVCSAKRCRSEVIHQEKRAARQTRRNAFAE